MLFNNESLEAFVSAMGLAKVTHDIKLKKIEDTISNILLHNIYLITKQLTEAYLDTKLVPINGYVNNLLVEAINSLSNETHLSTDAVINHINDFLHDDGIIIFDTMRSGFEGKVVNANIQIDTQILFNNLKEN